MMGMTAWSGSAAAGLLLFLLLAGTRVQTGSAGSIRLTECPADAPEATFSWTNDGDYLYVEGDGSCVTLPDIYNGVDNPPLTYHTVDGDESDTETGIWLLTKHLYMRPGTTLLLHDDLGCTELRIASSSTNALHLNTFGGYISILNTKVTSWSVSNKEPDAGAYDGSNPRSYMSAVSEMTHPSDTCDGAADDDAGEARLDIINSDVGYLGYQAAESYGLTYKVRGYCTDESNPEVFDRVNVRGDIRFSDIHHNWFGQYSYGHQDGLWEYNTMRNSGYYGFDPHDDSDNLRIHNNIVYENGNHGIIASKRCNDVSIQNNVVFDNALHGIMLHRSSDNGIIRNNTVTGSGSACIAIFESFGIEISDNVCTDNEEGIRLSMGSSYNKIFDNQVIDTAGRSLWLYLGSDEIIASAATDGMCTGNLFQNNYLDGASIGVKFSETRDNMLIGNTMVGVEESLIDDSDGLLWSDNEVEDDFEIGIETTCLSSESDFDQISAGGSNPSEC
ncbi:Mannuronan C-5-epimerase [Ectocarpus siliculosus]|uniref:Mannuronan C-5-epimerase n=1 Tax=Ectocarpus siliculosus TaxID=2880 RepID=D7G1G1_ECTSI|nr:Mannuronan C-5-epimerase [Ectocarpus siliculosus]|eukprot:CBJ26769.1 Mannuronan C-5-epimerase [Ectocarpus siliculosus]